MTANRWRRKPGGTVVAVRWTGDNVRELRDEFMNSAGIHQRSQAVDRPGGLDLQTIDGEWVPCPQGHWVIAEPVPDRFYPCDPDVFAERYERDGDTAAVDRRVEQVLEEHLLQGPLPGQCRCGHGDETLPVRELGQPHARHVVAALREAGLLA